MKPARSLRRDLARGLGGGIALIWLVALAGSWIILRNEVDEIYDAALRRTAEWMASSPTDAAPAPASRSEDMSYMRRTRDGAVLARSAAATRAIFGDTPSTGFRDVPSHRIYGMRLPDGSVLEVADPLEERREATHDTLSLLYLAGLALAPIIFFGVAWFIAGRLRPVRGFVVAVARRDSGHLAPLDAPGLQAEFLPIQEAVNRLMQRLDTALAAERAFSANSAHELRTPIAATLAHTQRLVAEAPDGPLRERARAIETELKRMSRLAEKLLDLARAESAGVAGGETADLRPILTLVAREFRAAPDLRPRLPAAPLPAAIDPDAFAILARNLIENALLHGTAPVEVVLGPGPALHVSNGGPPIPPGRLARLTHRFERLGSRQQGSGLGLAIVEALAQKIGARLEFQSPAPGRADGLLVSVTLPGLRAAEAGASL